MINCLRNDFNGFSDSLLEHNRLKFRSILHMLLYYFHLLIGVISQLFVEPPNKPIRFQIQVSFSIWGCYPKIVLTFFQPPAKLLS